VKVVVDFRDEWYAVIEGLQIETGHEHVIIAYPNENSLHDAFAASSIVAFGFATRDEAATLARTLRSDAVTEPKNHFASKISASVQILNGARQRREISSVTRRLKIPTLSCLGALVSSAIVIVCSSNTLSTAIRMALGGSV
jgi:hypothetical protein